MVYRLRFSSINRALVSVLILFPTLFLFFSCSGSEAVVVKINDSTLITAGDLDGDGISNELDDDIDGDGILNEEDDDDDEDGIEDGDDDCNGEVPVIDDDGDGCEDEEEGGGDDDDADGDIDTDGDGINDGDDDCPNENAEIDADGDGCEDDSDGDGIEDVSDLCPTIAAVTDDDGDGCEDESGNSAPEDISLCISAEDSYNFDGAGGGYSEGATATRISFDGVEGVDNYVVKLLLNNNAGGDDQYLYALININNASWSSVYYALNASEIDESFDWTDNTETTWYDSFYYCSISESSETISCYFDSTLSDSENTEADWETNMYAYLAAADSAGNIISEWTSYGYIESIGSSDEYAGLPSCYEENAAPVKMDVCMTDDVDSYGQVDDSWTGYSEDDTAARVTFDGVEDSEYYVIKLLLDNNSEGDDDRYLYAFIDIEENEWTYVNYQFDSEELEDGFAWEVADGLYWTTILEGTVPDESMSIYIGYYYCDYTNPDETIACYFDTFVFDSVNTGSDYENNIYASIATAESDGEITSNWAYFGYIDAPGGSSDDTEYDALKTCSD
jgi:hypothetical protein